MTRRFCFPATGVPKNHSINFGRKLILTLDISLLEFYFMIK